MEFMASHFDLCLWHQRPPIRWHCLPSPSPAALRKMPWKMVRTSLKLWKMNKYTPENTIRHTFKENRLSKNNPLISLVFGLGHTFQGCSNGCDVHPKEQPSRNRQEAQSPKHGGSGFGVRLASCWRWVSENPAEKKEWLTVNNCF